MNLNENDVSKIAKLARLNVNTNSSQVVLQQINNILDLVNIMQTVDTTNVLAMSNVHDGFQRLRDDKVFITETKEDLLSNAPEQEEGLFLVPKVIE